MWFLLIQIFLLMLLAALAGAALAYWWFRNRYEDVSVTSISMNSLELICNTPLQK